jgi:2-(1,2-epoxy-1,2-dihydrophenyl)acetyl-CoA isomerase
MSQHYFTDVGAGIAYFTLNRPERRNAVSAEIVSGLTRFLGEVDADPELRCLVIRGAGDHFMAGGDVKDFNECLKVSPEQRRLEFEQRVNLISLTMLKIRDLRKPVIASVQGAAVGYGLSLVAACDLVIAADDATFATGYISIGTTPDGGGSYSLPRLVGLRKAMELNLLGERFDAAAAREFGIVNRVVARAALAEETERLALRLARGPARALGNAKRLLNASLGNDLETQLRAEGVSFAECTTTDDMVEGVRAFNEKRRPRFGGAAE